MQSIINSLYELFRGEYGDCLILINMVSDYDKFKSVYLKIKNNEGVPVLDHLMYEHILSKIRDMEKFDETLRKYEHIRFSSGENTHIPIDESTDISVMNEKALNKIYSTVIKEEEIPHTEINEDEIPRTGNGEIIDSTMRAELDQLIDKNRYSNSGKANSLKRKSSGDLRNRRPYKRPRISEYDIVSDIYHISPYSSNDTHDILCYFSRSCECYRRNCRNKCLCVLCPNSDLKTLKYMRSNINKFVRSHERYKTHARYDWHRYHNMKCKIDKCPFNS